MDEIERTIVLPKGANPFNSYGRNYAFAAPDKVVATYLSPLPAMDLSKPGSCQMLMLPKFTPRSCTKAEIGKQMAQNARTLAKQTPAGKRRWFSNASLLPGISDGGCMQVSVEYDIEAHRVVKVVCN